MNYKKPPITGKEALNYLVDNFINSIEVKNGKPMNKETECVLILQCLIDRLEELEEAHDKLFLTYLKLKKAIKILKEELEIGVYGFTVGEKYDYIIEGILSSRISKEQYDLLKEVFENEI